MLNMLIVDDEDMERMGMRFLIEKNHLPLRLFEACDGKDALHVLQKNQIDILMTDIKMPRMDGIQLATSARELYPELYIIFCSAYGEFEYAKEAVDLKAYGYILRPAPVDEFIDTLTRVIEQCEREQKLREKVEAFWEKNMIDEPEIQRNLAELFLTIRSHAKGQSPGKSILGRTVDIVRKRYSENIGIEDIAEDLGISTGHLSRLFKKETGISVMQYVNLYRIEQAKVLLSDTDMKVNDIAQQIGFQSASYFGKVFKDVMNVTPNEFRNEADSEE